jgi:hypothetical protein
MCHQGLLVGKNRIVRDILPATEPIVTATGGPRRDSDNDPAQCNCLVDKMKKTWRLLFAVCSVACVLFAGILSCALPSFLELSPEAQYTRQRIPIEIQHGKSVTIEVSPSGNGVNCVGIRCPPKVWNALSNGTKVVEVRLMSSDKPKTEIGGSDPGSAGTGFLGYIRDVHYLFYIYGEHGAKATVEITFPNGPTATTKAEIIVGKTPIDTKPFGDL